MKKTTFKQKALKVTAVYLALSLFAEIAAPTMAYALTGGPSQPEVESFEPIGTTQMVDPFTGDFNYNIPLMTVPGPNGGYPINLAYHAGIGMEQEASWVGLGWNVNVGEINRSMRGLPDEFNGEKIKKTMYHKPSWTIGADIQKDPVSDNEFIGTDLRLKSSFPTLYYNNYKGVGFSWSFLKLTKQKMAHNRLNGPNTYKLDFSFDSQSGLGLNPSMSFGSRLNENAQKHMLGFGYNSRQGWTGLTLKSERAKSIAMLDKKGVPYSSIEAKNNSTMGAGMSFSGSSYIPGTTESMRGVNNDFKIRYGTSILGTFAYNNLHVFKSDQYVRDIIREVEAYGYQNMHNRQNTGTPADAIMDFNRENEFHITKSVPSLPLPVMTNDIYMVKGQGIASVFRPFRSDFGVLFDGEATSDNIGSQLGFEQGSGHWGFNSALSYSESYSGKWINNWNDLRNNYLYEENPDNESFYFKSSGEMFAADDNANEMGRYGNEDPVHLRVEQRLDGGKVFNKNVNDNQVPLTYKHRTSREPRVQHIEYRTRAEMENNTTYYSGKHLFAENSFPAYVTRFANTSTNGSAIDYSVSSTDGRNAKHFAAISMRNPDGNLYVYGLPTYNNKQREVVFAVKDELELSKTIYDDHSTTKSIAYNQDNASTSNPDGNDNYYSSTETPAYAHSHLLTAIYSPDYVDITGNGPSDDDFGYYVKFNYTKVYSGSDAYKWRNPLTGANLIRGNYSDQTDNKASYVYGEKEVYYLNSIETKTHIAEFWLSDRADGFGITNEEQLTDYNQWLNIKSYLDQTKPLKKLDKIILYSKADRSNSIKTIHFEYDYSLCGKVINNNGTSITDPYNGTSTDINSKFGKLTLKKVWFEYLANTKGKLSPYVFDYHETIAAENPDYNLAQMDRWGNYKPDNYADANLHEFSNEDNPYVTQRPQGTGSGSRDKNDEEAGVWSLKEIQLPSGGIMKIEYEADDYSYVQDRKAMQMMQVSGTGYKSGTTLVKYTTTDLGRMDKMNGEETSLIFFDLGENLAGNTDKLKKCFEGIELLYFKVMVRLKDKIGTSGLPAYDYVEGYAQIDRSDPADFCGFGSGNEAWVKVDFVPVRQSDNNGGKIHPFRKAAFEYMKLKRPDLLYASNPNPLANGTVIVSTLQTILQDVGSLLTGYYANCVLRGYARHMLLDETHTEYRPSFIRLNSPDGFKLGGGHRVKSIRISDEWDKITHEDTNNNGDIDSGEYNESAFEYGQEFTYTTKNSDGEVISSGVAEYEPLIGGNESPFRMPSDRYVNKNRLFHSNLKELYLEEPIGESFYPAASVGYSKVTTRNLKRVDGSDNEINKKTATGSVVQEFYTAKDFPVIVKRTDVEHKGFQPPVLYIPFVGNQEMDYHTYSQGYKIELNDMHGKPKSMATYSNDVDIALNPELYSTRVTYIYNTMDPYDSNRPEGNGNRLNNLVTVLDADADYRMALLGQTSEFCIDMIEHRDFGLTLGLALNSDYTAPATLFASLWPSVELSKESMQTVVTNKVINKNGILVKVISEKDGVKATSENLMFDSKTGTPLLTAIYNNFDAPVYSYSFAGHWAYEGLEPSYKNYRKTVTFSTAIFPASGVCGTIVNPENSFLVGDMVEVNNAYYWVDQVTPGTSGSVRLVDEDGTFINGSFSVDQITVMKTARTNQQAIPNGTIVALKNPVTERRFPLFDALNTVLAGSSEAPISPLAVNRCDGEESSVTITLGTPTSSTTQITFADPSVACESSFILPFVANTLNDLRDYEFQLVGSGKVKIVTRATSAVQYVNWPNSSNCFAACMDDVLHADATRFSEGWDYEYTDAGVPSSDITILGGYNDWRAGRAGVWRTLSTHAYRVPRKQTSPHTDIAKDGTYQHFTIYNWKSSVAQNALWTQANEITRYNPYGFELENKDAIGIRSSALYGYGNTSATAVAANASYFEIGYNSFESISGNGHLALTDGSGNPAVTSTAQAHTGAQSVSLTSGYFKTANIPVVADINATGLNTLSLQTGKRYAVSAWIYSPSGSAPVISAFDGSSTAISGNLKVAAQQVEGWYLADFDFVAPTSGTVELRFEVQSGGAIYLDDVRLVPYKGSIVTYVYDPLTLWLLAELDNRNYATFYNYDESGAVVQVKKETEKGVMTIKSSRNNTHQK